MRTVLVVLALAGLALAPAVAAGHVSCSTPGVVCVRGTLAAWVTPLVTAQAGQTVVFTSLDTAHPALVGGLAPAHGVYSSTTVYENVPAGTYDFQCGLHPWMVGQLVVQ